MKKSLLVLAVASLSTSALAQQNQVTFIAEMKQTSCQAQDVTVQWQNSETNINELRSAGGTTGKKGFNVVLTQCPGAYKENGTTFNNVSIAFDKSSANITDEGTLKNMWDIPLTASENIQLQILENDSVLNLTTDDVQQSFAMKNTDGTHTFAFEAQLVSAEGGGTSGMFASVIPFSVVYK